MKRIILFFISLSFLFSVELLQEGIFPECSYVDVTADGWRIHRNYEGRVLSMKAPGSHNDKLGKYSFDKFGNLISYKDCQLENKNNKILEKEIEIEVELNLFSVFDCLLFWK